MCYYRKKYNKQTTEFKHHFLLKIFFYEKMACFCVYNENDWDDLTYCFNCRIAKTQELKKKHKRIRYEKRRNKKYVKKGIT